MSIELSTLCRPPSLLTSSLPLSLAVAYVRYKEVNKRLRRLLSDERRSLAQVWIVCLGVLCVVCLGGKIVCHCVR